MPLRVENKTPFFFVTSRILSLHQVMKNQKLPASFHSGFDSHSIPPWYDQSLLFTVGANAGREKKVDISQHYYENGFNLEDPLLTNGLRF